MQNCLLNMPNRGRKVMYVAPLVLLGGASGGGTTGD